jgi:hypothetical protein
MEYLYLQLDQIFSGNSCHAKSVWPQINPSRRDAVKSADPYPDVRPALMLHRPSARPKADIAAAGGRCNKRQEPRPLTRSLMTAWRQVRIGLHQEQ